MKPIGILLLTQVVYWSVKRFSDNAAEALAVSLLALPYAWPPIGFWLFKR